MAWRKIRQAMRHRNYEPVLMPFDNEAPAIAYLHDTAFNRSEIRFFIFSSSLPLDRNDFPLALPLGIRLRLLHRLPRIGFIDDVIAIIDASGSMP